MSFLRYNSLSPTFGRLHGKGSGPSSPGAWLALSTALFVVFRSCWARRASTTVLPEQLPELSDRQQALHLHSQAFTTNSASWFGKQSPKMCSSR